MPHELKIRIADIRRRALRLSLLYGLSWLLGAVLASALALGLADYLIRFHDPGIRVVSSIAMLSVFCWAAYRYFYPAAARRLGDVEIAQKVERRFPTLGDRLSSSIEFLRQNECDPEAGSASLRRAVVVETTAAIAGLNLLEVLERRPTQRALAGATAILGLVLFAIACDPLSARLAAARLLKPLGGDAWPRQHELVFRNPALRLATGQTFEVELVDQNHRPLPDEVRIHYLYEPMGQKIEEVETMHLLDGVMVARKENVDRPFMYRAEGGDDQSMEWVALDVVEPPRIASLKATLYPPPYTGWPVEEIENNMQALRGSRVAFAGTTTKPLHAATLRHSDGSGVSCAIAPGGYKFELAADAARPFVVEKSGEYWFELQDTEQLTGGQESRWEIRVVADAAPSVDIEQPSGNRFVTPAAVVPLRIVARDDLAIHEVVLHFSRSLSTDTEDGILPLFVGPTEPEPSGGLSAGLPGDMHVVEHDWELAALNLKPGSQVAFYASATDYLPQSGRSSDRRLSIITPQELTERLGQRQGSILSELRRVLLMQQESRSQTAGLEIQLKDVGHLDKQDIDHVQGVELSQRQITRTLTSPTEGVPGQIKELLADLATNRIDNEEVSRRMQDFLDRIDRLGRDHLAPIDRELTSAIKQSQVDLTDSIAQRQSDQRQNPSVAASLGAVGEHQDETIKGLEEMLNQLSEWDSYRHFRSDLAQIERGQAAIAEATKQLGGKTLGKEHRDLDVQQQADLKKLFDRQAELGRQFDKLLQQMDEACSRPDENNPFSSATIADALHVARQQATADQMRSAGTQLERNQLGQAGHAQEVVRKDLKEMLDILSNRRGQQFERLADKLREADQQLAELRREFDGLRKKRAEAGNADLTQAKTADARRELDRLTRQERDLQKEISRLARRLERLQAERAGQSAASGAAEVGRASAASEKGDSAAAREQSDLAEKDLEEAQRQLTKKRKQVESDLAQAQMGRFHDMLKSLEERESQIIAETERLENLRTAEAGWSRAQMISVRSLAREQKALEQLSREQSEKLADAAVFKLALDIAAHDMADAAAKLDQSETGLPAQQAERDALVRLGRALEAMKPSGAKPPAKSGGGGGQGGQSAAGDGNRGLAELKLLKLMQEDLNQRYSALDELRDAQSRALQLPRLGDEQGRLAEVALKLSQPIEENPEDDPDKLPDVRQEPIIKQPVPLEDSLRTIEDE